jgi:hypothetical protein
VVAFNATAPITKDPECSLTFADDCKSRNVANIMNFEAILQDPWSLLTGLSLGRRGLVVNLSLLC